MIHARCTLFWHLPTRIARCTMKSDRRSHPQATRRQRGRAVTQGLPAEDRVPSKARTGRPGVAPAATWPREGGEALPFHLARKDRIRFRCAEACGPWLYIHGSNRNDPGFPPAIRCAIPRTRRWAGAATPTQRNTTQAQERARRASDVINISNFTSKNNPPWRLAEPPGPARPPAGQAASRAEGTGRGDRRRHGRRLRPASAASWPSPAGSLLSWLAAIPRRLGDRLFAMNDTEAYWRGWQITRTHGGLGRRYRDPRFDTLAECPKCRGAGGLTADLPCLPCLGTGRITLGEVS